MTDRAILLEPSPVKSDEGQLVGRDPRTLTPADFDAAGVPLNVPMAAIRAKCLDCCAGVDAEVRKCVSVTCPLWPVRMGVLPRTLRAALRPEKASGFARRPGGGDEIDNGE